MYIHVSGSLYTGCPLRNGTIISSYTVQYSTVTVQLQYSYSTVQYSTVQYSTVKYSTVQYSTVQYR